MRVAIHQPNFFARLKVLQKIGNADIWVVLDDAQYVPREYQNRTALVPVHGQQGPFWLTLPVRRGIYAQSKINEMQLADRPTVETRVSDSIRHAFHKSPFWADVEELIKKIELARSLISLTTAGVRTAEEILNVCGFRPKIVLSSELSVAGKGSKWMAAICREVGATQYLADSGAMNYLDLEDFGEIPVVWQQWREPSIGSWPQISSWRDISYLNLLAREGLEAVRSHLDSAEFVVKPLVTDQ